MRRDFVDRAGFEKLLSAKGISNDDTVVLYGGNNNWFAAYAYWYFKLYGHDSVKLVDGGRKKWELDGRQLITEVPDRIETTYVAKDQDLSIRALRDEVVAAIGVQNLVDVRSPDEFSGKLLAPAHLPQEAAQRGGHIPTAVNVPWSKAANEDGTFRSDAELTELYGGLDDSKDTIAYCRIGERSSHTWFVLTEILGKRERQELRRFLDRVRLARRRADRDRFLTRLKSERTLVCRAEHPNRAPSYRPASIQSTKRSCRAGFSPKARRCRARSSGCSTPPASSPPRW